MKQQQSRTEASITMAPITNLDPSLQRQFSISKAASKEHAPQSDDERLSTIVVNTRSSIEMVNVADLHVDPIVQRYLEAASKLWVKKHVPEFDAERLGTIVVSRRSNGMLYTIDGQNRTALLRTVGWGDQKIRAEVFDGLTLPEEAAMFLALNDRRAIRRFDRFRISIQAGDPVAIDIDRIVREHGFVISSQLKDGHIAAVDALENVYRGGGIPGEKSGPSALGKALHVLMRAWGSQPSSINGKIIQALGFIFLRYGAVIDADDLIKKLAPFPGGAPGLIGRGRSQQEIRGRSLHHCIASTIVDIYNKGRRTTKLDAWES